MLKNALFSIAGLALFLNSSNLLYKIRRLSDFFILKKIAPEGGEIYSLEYILFDFLSYI